MFTSRVRGFLPRLLLLLHILLSCLRNSSRLAKISALKIIWKQISNPPSAPIFLLYIVAKRQIEALLSVISFKLCRNWNNLAIHSKIYRIKCVSIFLFIIIRYVYLKLSIAVINFWKGRGCDRTIFVGGEGCVFISALHASGIWPLFPSTLARSVYATLCRVVDRERGKRSYKSVGTKLNAYWRSKSRRTLFKAASFTGRDGASLEFGQLFFVLKLDRDCNHLFARSFSLLLLCPQTISVASNQ